MDSRQSQSGEIDRVIHRGCRALCSLAPSLPSRENLGPVFRDAIRAASRGYFLPNEDERIREAFARYLSVRAALYETLLEMEPIFRHGKEISERQRCSIFALAFCAASMLIRTARYLVDTASRSGIVREKLDEAEPQLGIPRNQFTAIYDSLTRPDNLIRFHHAVIFARKHQQMLNDCGEDAHFRPVLDLLDREQPEALRFSRKAYARYRIRYFLHTMRRRRRSSLQSVTSALFEAAGRTISDVRNPFHAKRVTAEIREQLRGILEPGDVFVTRHDDAMSNWFLPGFWPHAALYAGTPEQRRELGVPPPAREEAKDQVNPSCVLEAKKDGVRIRTLDETLSVDAVALIRPQLSRAQIGEGLRRAMKHEGKGYDFEFDFTRADRLVCTEVVYRGFHGLGGLDFKLTRRAGRHCLSAEDLLARAVDADGFEVVAVFGLGHGGLLTASPARDALRASLAAEPAPKK